MSERLHDALTRKVGPMDIQDRLMVLRLRRYITGPVADLMEAARNYSEGNRRSQRNLGQAIENMDMWESP